MLLIDLRRQALRLVLLAGAFVAPISLHFAEPYPLFVLAIWLATAAAIALAARELWPDLPFGGGVATLLVSAVLAWGAAISAFVSTWVLAFAMSLCGKDPGWSWAGPVLLAYGLVGSWALAGRPRRALLGWPLAVLVAAAVGLFMLNLLPDATTYCES
jgi:hypothetical protein